ncbi:MAG: carbohydrate ABC transporter permease [Microbacteriaceae bacterium]|nr:MAG: carbohydrate ABC transporter permease [Microbacteriaceae bacterium]
MTARAQRRLRTTVAALIAIPFIVPFLFLIGTAFRARDDYIRDPGGLPHTFTWSNVIDAWQQADLGQALVNTLIVCVVACFVCSATAVASAYWFRRHAGTIANRTRWLLVIGYAIPAVAWLIPVFVIASNVGLSGNLVIAGIVNGVSTLPFALYLVHTFFGQVLTGELLEASELDGAGAYRTFGSIALPLAMPVLAAVVALTFVWTFGDLLIAETLLQADPSSYTITLAATSLSSRDNVNLQGQAAAALVALVPTLVVFAFAQRALTLGFGGVSDK